MATFAAANSAVTERCGNCGSSNPDLKACSKCKAVKYCNRECQVAHWKAGHKNLCGQLGSSSSASISKEGSTETASVVPSAIIWPDFFTQSASDCAKCAHRLKWKGEISAHVKQGSFAHSQIYRGALQGAIANATAEWPRTQRGAKNNRIELISAIVEKLNVLLEFFYLHAAHKSGSKKKGALLIESDTMFLENLVNKDAGEYLHRPVAVHFFTQKELVQYFVDFCSSDANQDGQQTAKKLLDTCNLEDPLHRDHISLVIAMKHNLDNKSPSGGSEGSSFSHCHTMLSIPNGSADQESYLGALHTMNEIYEQAEGLAEAEVLEVDLVCGDVVACDLKKHDGGTSKPTKVGDSSNVSQFAQSLV